MHWAALLTSKVGLDITCLGPGSRQTLLHYWRLPLGNFQESIGPSICKCCQALVAQAVLVGASRQGRALGLAHTRFPAP